MILLIITKLVAMNKISKEHLKLLKLELLALATPAPWRLRAKTKIHFFQIMDAATAYSINKLSIPSELNASP